MKLSPSGLQIARYCRYPFASHWEPPADEEDTPYAPRDLGRAFHLACSYVINQSIVPSEANRQAAKMVGLDEAQTAKLIAMNPGGAANELLKDHPSAAAEVAFALDLETGACDELGRDLDRDYGEHPPHVLCGTADAIWYEHDPVNDEDTFVVRDWKTGRPDLVHMPGANDQLWFYALCVFRFRTADKVRIELAFVADDGDVRIEDHVLYPFDVIGLEQDLMGIVESIPGAQPQPGPHCTGEFCPMRFECPAAEAAVAEVIPEGLEPPLDVAQHGVVVRSPEEIVSDEHAAWIYARLGLAQAVIDNVKKSLKAYADAKGGSFATREGYEYRASEKIVEKIASQELEPLVLALSQHFSTDEVRDLIRTTVNAGDLDKLARKKTPSGKGAAFVRDVMATLRGAGLVQSKKVTEYREAKARKK